mgnify:CR=1 FL=1
MTKIIIAEINNNQGAIVNRDQIAIGQIWQRKNGDKVEIIDSMNVWHGHRTFKLRPLQPNGRESWKSDTMIAYQLKYVSG